MQWTSWEYPLQILEIISKPLAVPIKYMDKDDNDEEDYDI